MAPAAALRAAQRWLRTVTFRELKERFAVGPHAGQECLLIGAPAVKGGTRAPSRQNPPDAPPSRGQPVFAMPLGADDDTPFQQPHEWAACTLTGL